MVKPDLQAQAQAILARRNRCKTDKLYLAEEMGYDFVPAVHKELFDQFIPYDTAKPWQLQSEIKKRLILWSRGHYKTTAIVVEIVQIILNFPDIRVLIMQGGLENTKTLLQLIKSHFNGANPDSHIGELFPEFCAPRLGNEKSFTVPARTQKGLAQATVTCASPGSLKTGQHHDIGFFDDLVNEHNYSSKDRLKKVITQYRLCVPLLDPPFYVVMTGTRYAFGDLYEEIMRWNTKNEWKVSVKTCWLDDNCTPRFPQQWNKSHTKLIGFTQEGLLELRATDPDMFGSQYLNQPIQHGGHRFTEVLLINARILPKDASALSAPVFFMDLASSTNDHSDDSVIAVGRHDQQMTQYVVDIRGGKWTTPEQAENLIQLALIYRPERIYIEKEKAAQPFIDYVNLVCHYRNIVLPLEALKVDQQEDAKNVRISALETLIKLRRLKFFIGLPHWEKIVEQFVRWPGGPNQKDDYPDTIALMAKTFGGETMLRPMLRLSNHPILAMIQEQDMNAHPITKPVDNPEDGGGWDAF